MRVFANFIYTILYDITYLFIPSNGTNYPGQPAAFIWLIFIFIVTLTIIFRIFTLWKQ